MLRSETRDLSTLPVSTSMIYGQVACSKLAVEALLSFKVKSDPYEDHMQKQS